MPKFIRKTKNLIIRPLETNDYDIWREYYLSMGEPLNQWDTRARKDSELTRKIFKNDLKRIKNYLDSDQSINLFAFEKRVGKMVGGLSLMSIVRSLSQSCFLGYGIHQNFWGKGYGKQAVAAIIDIAFKDAQLHRIEAGIEPYNRRSIMLARSLGLRKEGLKKRAVFMRGDWRDLVIYSATCEDFGIKWKKRELPKRL
jgi:RimJ/RimL family protein N-acetyltransferase